MMSTENMNNDEMETITSTETEQALAMSFDGFDIQVGEVKEVIVAETGYNTDCRVYIPEGDGPFPMLFFIHGGAFVGGFNILDEGTCRQFCSQAGVVVISPNYQLAPAAKYPVALNELTVMYKYFLAHADEYRINPSRLAIGGSSAGANYCTALAQMIAEEGLDKPELMILMYPTVDLYTDHETMNTPENNYAQIIDAYTEPGTDLKDPMISAVYAEDFTVFPRTCIFSGRLDALWDEGKRFADLLANAGVEVLYKSYAGMGHGFLELAGYEKTGRSAKNMAVSELKSVFADQKVSAGTCAAAL